MPCKTSTLRTNPQHAPISHPCFLVRVAVDFTLTNPNIFYRILSFTISSRYSFSRRTPLINLFYEFSFVSERINEIQGTMVLVRLIFCSLEQRETQRVYKAKKFVFLQTHLINTQSESSIKYEHYCSTFQMQIVKSAVLC